MVTTGESKMELIRNEYITHEFVEDDEWGMATGRIVMDGADVNYAEIIDTTMVSMDDVKRMQMFLEEVEKAYAGQ